MKPWRNFRTNLWQDQIDVRDFIQQNYQEYLGDEEFLAPATNDTLALSEQVTQLLLDELTAGGVLAMDNRVVSTVTSHGPGYLDASKEKIVGLQTDQPFKRAFHPFGGIGVAKKALESFGYALPQDIQTVFTQYRKTHNQGVFDVYTQDVRKARRSGIITGLPDGYGRGRIIGDYRRVALYGVDRLMDAKKDEKSRYKTPMNEHNLRLREEIQEQMNALGDLLRLGQLYGFDLSQPAANAMEAIQWTYLAYLAAVKEQNGAAMSLGRTATFLDIYIERDLTEGLLDEQEAQELIDHFIMKLRMVRFARTPEYNDLFTGDPTWVTESLAGMGLDGRSLVSKTTYRYLHTLYTQGTSAEPNLTVLWSPSLPQNFKRYCAKVSRETSAIQYENDDIMRPKHGDDYAIACCVSPMAIGKEMQFFGARANLVKALLYALNGGKDELSGEQVSPMKPVVDQAVLDFDEVMQRFDDVLDWLIETYVSALNSIHYMHDKYAYERSQMALHDAEVKRFFATGIAGLSVVADSLSAIKYAQVTPLFNPETGLIEAFETQGSFPCFGNNDDRVDALANDIVERFITKLRTHETYRQSVPTLSLLTITSNVVYGKKTGATPDGRAAGEAFAPGANPMHGRDQSGALSSLLSVAKLNPDACEDGISNTFTIVPEVLNGNDDNLVSILDGYFTQGGYHMNVNVLNRAQLMDAYERPEAYPNLTIRVSGYAVNFAKLTSEQKREVIERTFHAQL